MDAGLAGRVNDGFVGGRGGCQRRVRGGRAIVRCRPGICSVASRRDVARGRSSICGTIRHRKQLRRRRKIRGGHGGREWGQLNSSESVLLLSSLRDQLWQSAAFRVATRVWRDSAKSHPITIVSKICFVTVVKYLRRLILCDRLRRMTPAGAEQWSRGGSLNGRQYSNFVAAAAPS